MQKRYVTHQAKNSVLWVTNGQEGKKLCLRWESNPGMHSKRQVTYTLLIKAYTTLNMAFEAYISLLTCFLCRGIMVIPGDALLWHLFHEATITQIRNSSVQS